MSNLNPRQQRTLDRATEMLNTPEMQIRTAKQAEKMFRSEMMRFRELLLLILKVDDVPDYVKARIKEELNLDV